MSHGTETVYKLDLENIMDFPDSANVPVAPPKPGESWIIFGEIVRDNSSTRPVFIVKDKIDDYFPVVFYTENPIQDAAACKIGHILCITSGMRVPFSRDGGSLDGYIITDPSTVFVLPCSMAQLRALNKRLRDKNDRGEMDLCNSCKKPSTERCSKCQTPYCSRECQAADWKEGGHRKECPVIARLHIWNRTDWG
ncbi:hypothetical protein BDZ89DRAFT_1077701 [Hymenopellis radicata]|nr:hypothetical protein BDZ89DRAFT_1077701 [Hymenopellis radicata]